MKYFLFLISSLLALSCKETGTQKIDHLVNKWTGREIVYPVDASFTILDKDTNYLQKSEYTIVTYADSIGCVSCKLQLPRWKGFITQLDSMSNVSIPVLFFLYPKDKKEIDYILKRDNFIHPVCVDEKDSFNKLNHFPKEMMFQTFLLDKDNKVIAIGNPIHNPKVKALYLKIIMGDKAPQKAVTIQTTVACSNTTIDMGKFDWHRAQTATFALTNTGDNPLVVTDVVTSCGCTTVDYGKEPVHSGRSVALKVQYKADHPEHFDKTITVYCNAESSPLKLKITGRAE